MIVAITVEIIRIGIVMIVIVAIWRLRAMRIDGPFAGLGIHMQLYGPRLSCHVGGRN